MRNSKEIRESFLTFFEGKDHLRIKSFSLIPRGDPTLLLIGAGMAPFKAYFLGLEKPPKTRVTTCQKCVRADDIERVGQTARHHTFFEMLGNFSFGDYFKKEACLWAWEYLTRVVQFPVEKLYFTIHPDDSAAEKIWLEEVGIPKDRLIKLQDNFWGPIGATGPCGPCSEILYDRGEQYKCQDPNCGPGCDCDRFMEVWNLVFTGLSKDEDGKYHDLAKPCIDTGMGFERLVMILQDKPSPFETDLFAPLINDLREMAAVQNQQAERIIADHLRALVFMAGDGILPGNSGRGYVFRRILRRAERFGRQIGIEGAFLHRLAARVAESMGDIYPEIREKADYTKKVILEEEKGFQRTLEQGLGLLEEQIAKLKPGETLAGEILFRLYDTYGFPLEVSLEILGEKGFKGDTAAFETEMEKQREKAGKAAHQHKTSSHAQVEFVGYRELDKLSKILEIWREGEPLSLLSAGETAQVVLTPSPFYAESGGQLGDTGVLSAERFSAQVTHTGYLPGQIPFCLVEVLEGELKPGDSVEAKVDKGRRKRTASHHTATHILHWALRETLGKHVTQAGSLVGPERLRFDFTHTGEITPEQVRKVEKLINEKIREDHPVKEEIMPIHKALETGAMALFEEKYGNQVRVLSTGDFSTELCGGTHLQHTGEAGFCKILAVSAIGSGLRRVEALCGEALLEYLDKLETLLNQLSRELKVPLDAIPQAVNGLKENQKKAEQKLSELEKKLSGFLAEDALNQAEDTPHGKLAVLKVEALQPEALREMADRLKNRLKSGAVLLLQEKPEGGVTLLCSLTQDLMAKGFHAGKIVGELAGLLGGKGGGRPDFAQAGGKDAEKLPGAVARFHEIFNGEKI